jgi:hypothetical protein
MGYPCKLGGVRFGTEYRYDSHRGSPGDEDLLDLAALQTFSTGGTVYAVTPEQMPDKAQVAAIFHY